MIGLLRHGGPSSHATLAALSLSNGVLSSCLPISSSLITSRPFTPTHRPHLPFIASDLSASSSPPSKDRLSIPFSAFLRSFSSGYRLAPSGNPSDVTWKAPDSAKTARTLRDTIQHTCDIRGHEGRGGNEMGLVLRGPGRSGVLTGWPKMGRVEKLYPSLSSLFSSALLRSNVSNV